jgi:hypothetical protein
MIRIGKAYKHIGGDELYPTESLKVSLRTKIKKLIKKGIVMGNNQEVDISSLKEYLAYCSDIVENYLSIDKLAKLFEAIDVKQFRKSFNKLGVESPFDCIILNYPINLQTIYISKISVGSFFRQYISVKDVESGYDLSYSSWIRLFQKLEIIPFTIGYKKFIKKSEYEIIVEELKFNSSDYYTLEEYKQILSVKTKRDSLAVEKDYYLESQSKLVKGGFKYYKKEAIDTLKTRQTELREKYISAQEAERLAAAQGINFSTDYIKGEPIDSLLRPFFKKKVLMFLKEDFNNWLKERQISFQYGTIKMESDFDTFLFRLEVKKIYIDKLGKFTSETWMQYIESKLKRSKVNMQSMDSSINKYLFCTEQLINLVSTLNNREIYSLTSNDINTFFNEIKISYSRVIYAYLKELYYQLEARNLKSFNFSWINDPNKKDNNTIDKSIYKYEEYKEVFNFAKNIFLHKEQSIKDVMREISTGKKPKYLASSWLYVLLHLNNAWRHSDVTNFPRVDLSATHITDFNWMLENELSDEDADYIVKQVYRTEFIISKTQVKNYFFCSEELIKTIATAIAICELRTQALFPLRETLIDFGNKWNEFSKTRRKWFFKFFHDEEFSFSSRKMNRSLLTYIYVLLSKIKKGTAGLKTVQKMRGHIEKETTNIYIDIPIDELNFLTKQLFSRGSFGFIYDTFLDVLQGVEIDRGKRTTEIQFLAKYFGSINKIEEISGFLNVIQTDKNSILDRIHSMGLEETLEFMYKIETNQLPSKQDNIQCMVAESGCIKKGQGISCFDCAYSIPNYYALSALGASLQDRLNSYLVSHEQATEYLYYEHRKRARLFCIQLDLFAQAIDKFGFCVYDFISDSREDFVAHLSKIGSLKDQYKLS